MNRISEKMEDFIKHSLEAVGLDSHSEALLHLLNTIGVEHLNDVSHVVENDLIDILKPIQARKLLAHWR